MVKGIRQDFSNVDPVTGLVTRSGEVGVLAITEVSPGVFAQNVTMVAGGGGATVDRELIVTTYRAKNAFSGANIGDTITCTQILDVTTLPSTIATIWRNQSTALDLASPPSIANLELAGTEPGLTEAQFVANIGNSLSVAAPATGLGNYTMSAATKRLLLNDVELLSAVGKTTDTAAPTNGTGNYNLVQAAKRELLNDVELLTNTLNTAVVLGDKADISAPDNIGAHSLISLTKRNININESSAQLLSLIQPDLGTSSQLPATNDTGTFSIVQLIKRGLQNWSLLFNRIPSIGQKDILTSMPVVIASDQQTLNVIDAGVGTTIDNSAPQDGSGSYTIVSAMKRLLSNGFTSLANVGYTTDPAAPANATGNYSLNSAQKRALLNDATMLANDTTLITNVGNTTDLVATTDTGTFSIIQFIKRGLQNWTTILSRIPILGQALMPASIPVVIASNQSAVAINDPANATVVPGTAPINSKLAGGQFNTVLPTLTTGQTVAAQYDANGRQITAPNITRNTGIIDANTTRTISATDGPLGTQADSVATTDTGTFSLVGFAKRAMQNWTNLFTRIPVNGQSLMATSIPVTIASNQSAVLINNPSNATVVPGTAPLNANITGGQFNTTLPTLTNGQTVASQVDTNGRQLVATQARNITVTGNITTQNLVPLGVATVGSAVEINTNGLATISFQASGTFTGNFVLQLSNDGLNWATVVTSSIVNVYTGALTTNFLTTGLYEARVSSAIRARITTVAVVTGTLNLTINASAGNQLSYVSQQFGSAATRWFTQLTDGTNSPTIKAGSNAALVGDAALVVALSPNNSPNINYAIPNTIIDVNATIITASGFSPAFTPTSGGSNVYTLRITAASGTSPTIDVIVQESVDNGTTWVNVYSFERQTIVNAVYSSFVTARGNRIRYSYAVSGTTPSFTTTISRTFTPTVPVISGGSATINNGTITVGGTAQIGANQRSFRNTIEFQNTSPSDMFIRFGGQAGLNAGFKVLSNSSWSNNSNYCPDSSLSVWGSVTGQTFAILEG
jgi:hypothetical protein